MRSAGRRAHDWDMTNTAITALEQWNEHGQGHHGFPFLLPLVLIIGFLAIRRRRNGALCGPNGGPGRGSATSVLADRFARGEIDDTEYRTRRTVLTERPERPRKK